MTTTVLLDHVSAYAAAVRAHLADLTPEQVDDLTDGLEADLAEALTDGEGPVVTGEIPIGRAAADAGIPAPTDATRIIDLTRRFGPAAEYAAELRAAAGMGPATTMRPTPVRSRVRSAVVVPLVDLVSRWREALAPFLATAQGKAVVALLAALRPLWWVLRGWVWYVILASMVTWDIGRFVPLSPIAWFWLAALVALSISVGRGLGSHRRGWRRVVVIASIVALLWTPWATTEFRRIIEHRIAVASTIEYVESVVYEPVYEDGVVVDGIGVSNLFVYDSAGNPLTGVQIFDDRGRPVRTTFDDGLGEWHLPGVEQPWRFLPSQDVDGRQRWNVYPLAGAPVADWEYDDRRGWFVDGESRIPPLPFAKAPAVVVPDATTAASPGAPAEPSEDEEA